MHCHSRRVPCGLALVVCLTVVIVSVAGCRSRGAATSENVVDVPVYPGAVLRDSVVGVDLDPTEYYVVSGAPAADVQAWYEERMPEHGWEPSTEPDEGFVIYHTEEGCYGFVGVFARPDGTVDLQISQQRAGTPCYPFVTPDPNAGSE